MSEEYVWENIWENIGMNNSISPTSLEEKDIWGGAPEEAMASKKTEKERSPHKAKKEGSSVDFYASQVTYSESSSKDFNLQKTLLISFAMLLVILIIYLLTYYFF
ncbi:hypothetical protein NEFER03_0343 [Nematocida sp. LUAm3]|nr:hypothetical protein NEFER03_0343 [Nematocida sp. LUAm3]KAI5173795.1 hypothetical protein NEFER02_0311 [Nematocida sp. LUAm2]KAI5177018.1 hypothetical protein NEFER01_0343 [Nematocida sp. LUAm1]